LKIKIKSRINLSANFKEHAKVVDRINALNLSWKAENYDQFANMTIDELNNFTGRNRSKFSLNFISSDPKKQSKSLNLRNKPLPTIKNLYSAKRKTFFDLMRFREKEEVTESVFDKLEINKKSSKSSNVEQSLFSIINTFKKKSNIKDEALKQVSREAANKEVEESDERDKDFPDLPKNFLKWKDYCSKADQQV